MRYSEQLNLIGRFRKSAPVDVETLSFALGVPVHYAYLPDSTSGMIERTKEDRFRIVVNANHSRNRQRFTIAHELGHFMLHRHLIGHGIEDSRAFRSSEGSVYANRDIGPSQETQANKFAVGLLMPDHLVEKVQQDPSLQSAAAQAKALGVSEQAYCIRTGQEYISGFI